MGQHADNSPKMAPPPEVDRPHDAPARRGPAQVYCADDPDQWVVDPPEGEDASRDRRVFSGPRAQYEALLYAHQRFGQSRFFPF
jgi:hypothetical protein